MTENFPTFRGLLRGAICNRTQAQFALDSGISAEHLNRMLNAAVIHRPTKSTLIKIAAAAKNGITYKDLKTALDADDPTACPTDIKSPDEHLAAAREEFKPAFEAAAHQTMKDLAAIAAATPCLQAGPPLIVTCLADYMDDITAKATAAHPDNLAISYEICQAHPYMNKSYTFNKQWVSVILTMAEKEQYQTGRTAQSELIVYFTEMDMGEGDDDYTVILKASCAVADIMDLWGMPPAAMDAHSDKENNLEAALADPYYIYFEDIARFIEPVKRDMTEKPASKAEALLNILMGDEVSYSETIDGFGFWLETAPPRLLEFLQSHLDAILSHLDTPAEIADAIHDAMKIAVKDNDITHLLNVITDNNLASCQLNDKTEDTWGNLIAITIHAETGFPFQYFANTADCTEFPNMSEHSCVIIDGEDVCQMNIMRETLISVVGRYARELGLRTFGDILFTYQGTLFRKPRTYTLKSEDQLQQEEQNQKTGFPSLDEMDYSAKFERGVSEPEKSGKYAVELKDGRHIPCIWMASNRIWLRRHREWSDMIVAWCPTPIMDMSPLDRPQDNT